MHRSQLGGFIIDCRVEDLDTAAEFWGSALGLKTKVNAGEEDQGYVELVTRPDDLHLEVQKVDHESRVHLDIETDDIEAEVRRLEALGARRMSAIKSWVVMEAPTGQRFCVVRAARANFERDANRWE